MKVLCHTGNCWFIIFVIGFAFVCKLHAAANM